MEYYIVNKKIGYVVFSDDDIKSVLKFFNIFGYHSFQIEDEHGNIYKAKDLKKILENEKNN